MNSVSSVISTRGSGSSGREVGERSGGVNVKHLSCLLNVTHNSGDLFHILVANCSYVVYDCIRKLEGEGEIKEEKTK